jgi:hypothetical protein
MRGSRLALLALLVLGSVALIAAGCGDDDDGEGVDEAEVTVPEAAGELPGDLVAELEEMCAEMITEIGALEGEDLQGRIDLIQANYISDLEALTERVPESERQAFEAYVTAQEEAFALSPPPQPGEPQPELEEANATAEAAAAELGFTSCSGV